MKAFTSCRVGVFAFMHQQTDEEIAAEHHRKKKLAAAWRLFRATNKGKRNLLNLPRANPKSVGLIRTPRGSHSISRPWNQWSGTIRPA